MTKTVKMSKMSEIHRNSGQSCQSRLKFIEIVVKTVKTVKTVIIVNTLLFGPRLLTNNDSFDASLYLRKHRKSLFFMFFRVYSIHNQVTI